MRKTLRIKLPTNHKIIPFGDIHMGLKASSESYLKQIVSRLKKETNTYAFGVGDYIEGRSSRHDYYSVSATDNKIPLPILQLQCFKELIEPVKHKILFLGIGNHEIDIESKYGSAFDVIVCKPLGIPCSGYSNHATILSPNGKISYRIYSHHGFGTISSRADDPIRREANEKLQLKNKLKNKFGDCAIMVMGHTHKLIVSEPIPTNYLTGDTKVASNYIQHHPESSYIHPDYRWYINSGSALKTFEEDVDTYSEIAGYDPIELGYAEIIVVDGKVVDVKKTFTGGGK